MFSNHLSLGPPLVPRLVPEHIFSEASAKGPTPRETTSKAQISFQLLGKPSIGYKGQDQDKQFLDGLLDLSEETTDLQADIPV